MLTHQNNPSIEEFKQQALCAARSEIINSICLQLQAKNSNEVEAIEISQQDLARLNLDKQFVLAKVVKLPSDFRPPLELHQSADQLTVVLSGSLVWVQQEDQTITQVVKKSEAVYTKAGVFHAHATGSEPCVLLALFNSKTVNKDQLKQTDWDAYFRPL